VQHSDNAPYAYGLSHLPCSATVFGNETNCSLTKVHVTPVSYRDSRTDSFRLSPIREIQQKATAVQTAITNRTSRGSLTNGSTAVASVCVCVCVRVRACVHAQKRAVMGVAGLGFVYVYIMLCTMLCSNSRKSYFLSCISLENKVQICG
jgi:hypothetical protein